MTSYVLEWVIREQDENRIIKEFVASQNVSARALTDIKFGGGSITVNSKVENVRYQLKTGDRLKITFPEESRSVHLGAENLGLSILYEDDDLIVLDKPAGMNTIPSRQHPNGSIANGLAGYYEEQGIAAGIHIVTRLDRNTSGIVLAAKHRHAHHLLDLAHQSKTIIKGYEAFVEGVLERGAGTIQAPIGRKEDSIIERTVREDGKPSVTHYQLVQQYERFAHVRITLETGRTHQIRVHFQHITHPLLGDDLYGGPLERMKRQALHCARLELLHPITSQPLLFQSALHDDMARLLASNE